MRLPRPPVLTYSKEDYGRIAKAIDKSPAEVVPYENEFEAAATWYRLNIPPAEREGASTSEQRRGPTKKPKTLSALRKKVKQIDAAARKLLTHLGVYRHGEALDGPRDRDLLIFLASYSGATEEEVIQATARIGCLAELSEAINAAKSFQANAATAAQEATNLSAFSPEGHRGDAAENDWIADMMSLYERITGRKARTSVIAPGRPDEGKASGPLIRFLGAAGAPLRIEHSPESWRGRIRDSQIGGRRQK